MKFLFAIPLPGKWALDLRRNPTTLPYFGFEKNSFFIID